MSTNKDQDDKPKPIQRKSTKPIPKQDDSLVELAHALDKIDENSPQAKLNANSISDNNGGRIELDDKKRRSTRVNMMDWIRADQLEQWKKDHPEHPKG